MSKLLSTNNIKTPRMLKHKIRVSLMITLAFNLSRHDCNEKPANRLKPTIGLIKCILSQI